MIARKIEARKSAFSARKAECGFVGALKSEEGAIDLASIMVGVIVIGVIAGVIAATVFAVIPWAQDKAASQSLDAVNQAESVAFAQSTDAGTGHYLSTTDAVAGITVKDGAGNAPGLLQASGKVVIVTDTAGTKYAAFSLSSTGNVYSTSSTSPNTATKLTLATAKTAANAADGTTKTFTVVAGVLTYA
jgi:type II secretory pathway pseudopilin PulG